MLMRRFRPNLGKPFMWSRGGVFIPTYRFTVVTTVPDETFALPLEETGTYDFNSAWGDGSDSDITVWNHADVTHTYAVAGTYTISITGTIIGWRFNNAGDCAKYHETKSWGPLIPGNSGGNYYGCINHTCTATDILNISGKANCYAFFRNNSALTEIPSINSWDWSTVTSLANVLQDCGVFDQDLSGLNISSLINATGFLLNTTLSVANFNALILSWSPQAQTIVANFHGGNSKYTGGGAVEAARDAWVAKGWTITDGGIAP